MRPFPVVLASLLLCSTLFSQSHGSGGSHGSSGGSSTSVARPDAAGFPTTMGASSGSTSSEEGRVEFRSSSILVQVPVIITDNHGNHIHGLDKSDFHIFENGTEQRVSVFEEVNTTASKIQAPTPHPGVFQNLTIAEDQPRNITVIALDTINTPYLDQAEGRRELVRYLANNIDTNQVLALMLMSSHGLNVVQGLTGDPAQLLQGLKKITGETPVMEGISSDAQADVASNDFPQTPINLQLHSSPELAMEQFIEHGDAIAASFQQTQAIEATLNGFMGIAWTLSGIPGRKSLIWATSGFPFILDSPDSVPGGQLSVLYERTMQALTEAQVSIYPVDVAGLVNTNLALDASRHPSPYVGQIPTQRQLNNFVWLQQSSTDTLESFAEMTGGRAFFNTNDLSSSFKRAADDSSSYYLLGYYLNEHNDHAGWRSLKVKVDKKDVEVRARQGFFVTNATLHMALTRTSDLQFALVSPIEGTGVPMAIKWAGVAGTGSSRKAAFVVNLPLSGLTLDSRAPNGLNFDFAVAAYPANGKDAQPAGTFAKRFETSLSETQLASIRAKGVDFHYDLDLAPGKYAVRFVVRDNMTGKVGSVTAPLTVN